MGSNPLQNLERFYNSLITLPSNRHVFQAKCYLRRWEGSALKPVADSCVPAKTQPSHIQLLTFSATQSSVRVHAPAETVLPLDCTGELCSLLRANCQAERYSFRCSSPYWPVSSPQYFRVWLLCFVVASLGLGGDLRAGRCVFIHINHTKHYHNSELSTRSYNQGSKQALSVLSATQFLPLFTATDRASCSS